MRIFSAKCLSSARLDGKTALITGSNTGIGKCTAQDFYKRGARVIMACRDCVKADSALKEIQKNCEGTRDLGELVVTELDVANLESVRKCAKHVLQTEARLDILVNNAGVMACPKGKTKDGFETHLGTNHLGHFLLTLMLLPKLYQSQPSRIVNVSSMAHLGAVVDFDDLQWEKRKYSAKNAYGQSKLANIFFTQELARRLKENNIEGVTTYTLHPGVIKTELGRHLDETYFRGMRSMFSLIGCFLKTPEQGAQTSIHCSVDEKAGKESGLYYAECDVKQPYNNAKNPEAAKKLWEVSLGLVGLGEDYNPFKDLQQ